MDLQLFSSESLWLTLLIVIINILSIYYYLTHIVQHPRLICAHGALRVFLQSHVPIINGKYWPTFWCLRSGAQTVIANVIRQCVHPKISYRREILNLHDGGELALDWLELGCNVDSPCIIIIPGLIGESQTQYMRSLALAANGVGFRVVCFNYRGLGGVRLKTPRFYTLSCSEDLAEVIRHVRANLATECRIGCVAVSLGSLMLGTYLAKESAEARKYLSAAMMISPPFDVKCAIESLEMPVFNRLFGNAILVEAKKIFKTYTILRNTNIDTDMVLKSETMKEFAIGLFVKSLNFESYAEFCEDAKLYNKLERIKIPLLCLCAADDIFQPINALPIEIVNRSSHVALLLTAFGGHIGFLEGVWPFRKKQYVERLFMEYFTAVLYDVNGSI